MEKQDWPSTTFVKSFNTISSVSELYESEVYVIVNYEMQLTQKQKAVGVVSVLNRDLNIQRIWSVTMIDNAIVNYKLPILMNYGGMKSCRGGKKMHIVHFAPIPDDYKWIRQYCADKRWAQVSKLSNCKVYPHANYNLLAEY